MKIPLPAKLRAFVKRAPSSTDEEEAKQQQLEEENKAHKEQLAKQLNAYGGESEHLAKQLKADEILRAMGPSIDVNFIDEGGEVLQLQARPRERTSHLFDRYARQQRTPFLLSRIIYRFRYNGELIPLNSTVEEIGIAAGDDTPIIIYVTKNLPDETDFDNKIVPNIPSIVINDPFCFINEKVSITGSDGSTSRGVVRDCSGDGGRFFIATRDRTATSDGIKQYDMDEFTVLLQDNYSSDSSGYTWDVILFLESLVSNYESQVEQLDTDQSLDKPNAIILRMIKIRQQIYRLLDYMDVFNEEKYQGKGWDLFSHFTDRLRKALSLLTKKRIHLTNTSIHKVNKPLYESEDRVRAKHWPNNNKNLEPSWEKGTVRSYTEHEDVDGYGPRRVYSVEFEFANGKCRSDVEDYHVIPDGNYTNKSCWDSVGINRVFDKDSSDRWAREVGWYTVVCGEEVEEPLVYLTDAIRAINLKRGIVPGQQKQMELGMLQLIDRLSDPIMRRIGRILIQLWDYISGEKSGFIWKVAYGHYNDKQTNQMRDGIYKLALLKQGKRFGSYGCVNINQVCRFFIASEGCLDTFLLKVPYFREGYDYTVRTDKNEGDIHDMMKYLIFNQPEDADEFMWIKFVDGEKTERYTVECNAPLKQLLMNYADDRDTSIKSLRIKHNDRTLFLSSIGKKTPEELNIEDGDELEITIMQTKQTESTSEQPKQQTKGKNKKKKKHKQNKKKRVVQPLVIQKTETELRGEHSKLLGKIHEEAEPTFKEIRQRLNAMNLERTKPKQRTSPSKTAKPVEVVDNPLGNDQLDGKAGKTQFIIQVGEVSNLYKTTKSSSAGRRRQKNTLIDLHGLTAEEAVYMLDKHLPDWIETAMKGTYPFVIPVKIICGGGSQILAEVVENWIKQNDHVANAPKNMYS